MKDILYITKIVLKLKQIFNLEIRNLEIWHEPTNKAIWKHE